MAGVQRVVRVSGLPLDLPDNRLMDKIQIHFLRKKNGGGEISSLRIHKPGTAFITFEEHEVASRLVKQGQQAFAVNSRTYDVMLDFHSEEVDELFVEMSVTVDHRKLLEGKRTLLSLHEPFTGVSLTFDPQTDLYTLKGCYTEVQALSKLVRGSMKSQNTGDGLPLKEMDSPVGMSEAEGMNREAPAPEELGLKMESPPLNSGLTHPDKVLHQALRETLTEDRWVPETTFEDFFIVVDSDIFRYVQKCCNREYQGILRRHRMEVVDVTSQDITTLYIKPKKSLSERGVSSIRRAMQQLVHFYQEKGSQLRKEYISKCELPDKDLKHALESLQQKLPKLMIEEDEENVYMVGGKSDVSEAKQFFLYIKGTRPDLDANSDHLFFSSHSSFTSSNQGDTAFSEYLKPPDRFWPLREKFKIPEDLFNPKEDHQKLKKEGFFLHSQNEAALDKDLLSTRREIFNTSEERNIHSEIERIDHAGCYDKGRYTDSLFTSLDLYKRSLYNPDFQRSSEEPKPTANLQQTETTSNVTGTHPKSGSEQVKTKQDMSVRELKMAPNFKKKVIKSGDLMECSDSTKSAEDQKTGCKLKEERLSRNESKQSQQPHSLPFIKPSMNQAISLKLNTIPGDPGIKTSSGGNIMKGNLKQSAEFSAAPTEKKGTVIPTYFPECHEHISLGHLDLCEDISFNRNPCRIMSPGLARRRSNSLSGMTKEGQDDQTAVDLLFVAEKEINQSVQKKKVFTMNVPVSLRLWTYLKSVYSTAVDDLTSDLQIEERSGKEGLTLYLRGADSDQVSKCHRGLKSLFARNETDFDSRTLPLGMLGLSDCKDKTLVDFSTLMKQTHKKVKIVIMTTAVMILGPRSTCKEVEASILDFFHTGPKTRDWKPSKPSTDLFTTDNDPKSWLATEHPTPISVNKSTPDSTNKDRPKMSKQNNVCASKNETTGEHRALETVGTETQQKQDNQTRIEKDQETVGGLQLRENSLNLETESKADSKADGDHRSTATSQKNGDIDYNSQIRGTFTNQMNTDISGDHRRAVAKPHSAVLDVASTSLPSNEIGNQDSMFSCECGTQNSSVKQAACGRDFYHSQKKVHAECKLCPPKTNQDAWGIKGKMSVQELTFGLPGFERYTTLKIVYDIPDGIQGEEHPCRGTPFRGNRYEAYLPYNTETRKLLPLLEKAFHRGLTFTVRAGSADPQKGAQHWCVSWASIPHKTGIYGGAARNGYPDFTYIRNLTEALRKARLEE